MEGVVKDKPVKNFEILKMLKPVNRIAECFSNSLAEQFVLYLQGIVDPDQLNGNDAKNGKSHEKNKPGEEFFIHGSKIEGENIKKMFLTFP